MRTDIQKERERLKEQMKRLKAKERELDEKENAERNGLAQKVGLIILDRFEGKPFDYDAFRSVLDENFITDYERTFFGLQPLPNDDPRKPKKRGRKVKENQIENILPDSFTLNE